MVTNLSDDEKEMVKEKLHETYSPSSIGDIVKYPPNGEYFVTLYFIEVKDRSFNLENRYNVSVNKCEDNPSNDLLCNFELSNMTKMLDEINVTLKVTKQEIP